VSIYVKTPKGIEEVEHKAHGLALKARRVLITIDGKRDLSALEAIFPPSTVGPVLAELIAQGFVREVDAEPPPPMAPAPAPVVPQPTVAPIGSFLAAQKAAVTTALREALGPDADPLCVKVDKTRSLQDLAALASSFEELVAKIGGKKKAEAFADLLHGAGIEYASGFSKSSRKLAGVGGHVPRSTPAMDIRPLQVEMSKALTDFLGRNAEPFIAKVNAAKSVSDLDKLARKSADAIAAASGEVRSEAFLTRLWQFGVDAANPLSVSSVMPSMPPGPDTSRPAEPRVEMAPRNEAERFVMASQFMINTVSAFGGSTGLDIAVRIKGAKNVQQLRSFYYDWCETLKLTEEGRQRLPDLERRLAALLS
jgi:hypothetical protein